ncbi:eukaryotic translation initiation factor 4 gamma 3-like isoform X2 [Hypomesus transpacificus]|nr:eukaryotic translation initiation factor 4 gamma 3-like isoform X2 [Hypomesus transpacificus]
MLREAEGHLQTLEAEIVELRRAEAEHKPLAPLDERPHFFQKIPSITSAFGMVQRSVYRLQKQLEMSFDIELKDFFLEAKHLLEPHTLSSLADRVVEEHELDDYKDIESVRTKEMFAQMEDILGRLTPERFPQLMKVVATFPITTEERLRGIVDLIYEKAISDPDDSEAYAQMCKCLQLRKVPSSDKPGETLNFRKLMLNRCLVDFERKHTECFKEFVDKMKAATEEKRSLQGEKLEEVFSELLDKAVGNIKFICEFFKLNMMTEAQMHEFLTKLVRRRDAISIACFSTMLSTIGKDLDHGKAKPRMDQYYKHVEIIIKEKNSSVPYRHVLFELHQLLKDRQEEEPKNPELVKTQEMFAKMEAILIHVNRENFQQVMKEVGTLPINTEERLKGIIDMIYQKAISDPDNSEVYANMCRSQMGRKVPSSDNPGKTVNFRKLLLNRCQVDFDQDKTKGLREKQKELEGAVDNKDRIRLREEIRVITSEVQAEAVGNVKLISELFKIKMVTEAIIHDCIVELLKCKENIALSCVVTILSTVGKDLDYDKSKPRMDQYYNQIEKIVKDKKIPPHVCNELTELLEIRQEIWRNRDQKLAASKSVPGQDESGTATETEEK